MSSFDDGSTIVRRRLNLVPLLVADAEDLAGVLGDQRLHDFIGGWPATIAELPDRYARLVAGSSKPKEVWLNWIVRRRADEQPLGTVQASVTTTDGEAPERLHTSDARPTQVV